jgi:hypothetical protein
MLNREYPMPPLSAIPATLLNAFLEEQRLEEDSDRLAEILDEESTQRTYALFAGACQRASECGGLAGHDAQAAAILVAVKEFDDFLQGGFTVGGDSELNKKLNESEMDALRYVRRILVQLLDWHFKNGAGRLLPMADWLGLVRGER